MRLFLALLITFWLPWMSSAQVSESKMDLAPAYAWLELIDRGRFFQSWQYASEQFKQNIEASKWNELLIGARESLGALKSRQLSGFGERDTVAGLPKGRYWVFKFKSDFENQSLHELLVMTSEKGELKTVAYVIQ